MAWRCLWDKPGGGRAEGGCRTQDGAVLGFARNVARAPLPHRRASAWGAFGAGASVFKMIPPEGFSGVQPGVFLASEEPALPPAALTPLTPRATRPTWTEPSLEWAPPSPRVSVLWPALSAAGAGGWGGALPAE